MKPPSALILIQPSIVREFVNLKSALSAILILLPLALPSIAVVAIFVFLACWNDFLFALILTSTEAAKTMPVSLNELQSGYEIRWGVMTAGAVIHTLPAMLMVIFAQRYIITGMTMGAVKG